MDRRRRLGAWRAADISQMSDRSRPSCDGLRSNKFPLLKIWAAGFGRASTRPFYVLKRLFPWLYAAISYCYHNDIHCECAFMHDPVSAVGAPVASESRPSSSLPSEPLNIDPWVTSSLLQKAIRRGEADLAERAAIRLFRLRARASGAASLSSHSRMSASVRFNLSSTRRRPQPTPKRVRGSAAMIAPLALSPAFSLRRPRTGRPII